MQRKFLFCLKSGISKLTICKQISHRNQRNLKTSLFHENSTSRANFFEGGLSCVRFVSSLSFSSFLLLSLLFSFELVVLVLSLLLNIRLSLLICALLLSLSLYFLRSFSLYVLPLNIRSIFSALLLTSMFSFILLFTLLLAFSLATISFERLISCFSLVVLLLCFRFVVIIAHF